VRRHTGLLSKLSLCHREAGLGIKPILDDNWTPSAFSSNFTPDNDGRTISRRYIGRGDSDPRDRPGTSRHRGESAFRAGGGPRCCSKHEYARSCTGGRSPARRGRGAGAAPHCRAPSRRGGNSTGDNTTARFVGDDSPVPRHATENPDDPGIAHKINRVGPGRVATKAQRHNLFPACPVPHQRGGTGHWRGNRFLVLDKLARRSTQPVAEEQPAPEWRRLPLVDQSVPQTSLTLDRWRSSSAGDRVPHPILLCE